MFVRKSTGIFFIALISFSLAKIINEDEINKAFIKALKEKEPIYQQYDISANVLLKPYQKPLLNRKSEDIEVKVVLSADKKISGFMYVPIVIYENGLEVDNWRSKFKVKIFTEIYHSRKTLIKNDNFSINDFYLKPVDILSYTTVLADKQFNFTDKMVYSLIKANEPIPIWKFRKRALVLVGQTITVYFVYGNITVKAQAKVLQQGYRGEKIRIRVISSDKVFQATVLDSDRVEVRL